MLQHKDLEEAQISDIKTPPIQQTPQQGVDDSQASSEPSKSPAEVLRSEHVEAKAQFLKLKEALGHLQSLREELDRLSALGDMIDPDDVVKGAATLVSRGFTPHEVATVVSDMPMQGGEMLAQWVQMHDQAVGQMEKNAEGVMAAARHRLAVSSLRQLMQNHMEQQRGPQAPQAPPSAPLMGMTPQGSA